MTLRDMRHKRRLERQKQKGSNPLFRLGLLLMVFAATVVATNALKCAVEFGGDEPQEIPQTWIDDGYCDCPLDGADEPNTDACSGSKAWPGISQSASSEEEHSSTFQCPQQPNLRIPQSRIFDGVCDCCDGADEGGKEGGVCADICEEVLREEREIRAKLQNDFAIGSNKRKHELFAYKQFRLDKLKEIEELENQTKLDPEIPLNEANDLRILYLKARMALTKSIAERTDLLAGLNMDELRTTIILACQISGEISDDHSDESTCAALRLAAMEQGIFWQDDDFASQEDWRVEIMDDTSLDLANQVLRNVNNKEKSWKIGKSNENRRRLEEDMMYDDDHYDYDGEHYDDDYIGDYEDTMPSESLHSVINSLNDLGEIEKEIVMAVKSMPFSASRSSFLDRKNQILETINAKVATAKKSTDNSTKESSGESEQLEDSDQAKTTDPMVFDMLKSSLGSREATIVKGFRSAAAASSFLSANQATSLEQMYFLALYTIFHGKLSAVHVWKIVQAAVEELNPPSLFNDEKTCASPLAATCPPKHIQRETIKVPSPLLLQAGEQFCNSDDTKFTPEACNSQLEGIDEIPSTITDGYYGYYTPMAREDDDLVTQVFADLTSLPVDNESIETLEEESKRIEKENQNTKTAVTEMWNEIGGKDGLKMGPNGELYSLANKCFDVEAGKYTYEVCVFGDAKQKEGGNGGTRLGKFSRMEYDEQTGARVLYWENGQKCWNGPNRSATVHLTCGTENRVLSADEPDTCRYVLEMESYIACDEAYKQKMDL